VKSIIVVVPPCTAALLTTSGGSVRPALPSGLGKCHLQCTCGSIPPGITILPVASIIRAFGGTGKLPLAATPTIFSPAMAMS
jgi:hypothetical protein